MSQTLSGEMDDAGWEPVGTEPDPWQPEERTPSPVYLTVALSDDILTSIRDVAEQQKAHGEKLASVTEALKAHTTQMEAMFKRLDRVMSAPRSVTLKRDADGFAQSAISEPLVSKAKG